MYYRSKLRSKKRDCGDQEIAGNLVKNREKNRR